MSFAASIIARLGLDASGFRSELASTATSVEGANNKMASSARRNAAEHNNLLVSNHRVARQIQTFSKDILSGASATDIFSAGLEGLERSLKLSIGSLAALGIGAVVVQQIGSVIGEYEKLGSEIDKVLAPRRGSAATPLSEAKSQAQEATAAVEKLDKANSGLWRGILNGVILDPYRVVKSQILGKPKGADDQRDEQRAASLDVANSGNQAEATHQRRLNAINSSDLSDPVKEALRGALEWREKILEAAARGGDLIAGPLKQAAEIDLKKAADKIADARKELLKLSLDALAKGPTYKDANHASPQAIYNAEQARKAQELEKQSSDLVLNQADIAGAKKLSDRGYDVRGGIDTLKDSQKDLSGELRGALDSCKIVSELQTANQNILKINFSNL